jgi:hypothetical protein
MSQLPSNIRPEANLVAGAPEKIGASVVGTGPIDALATIVAPASADPEQAWAATLTTDTPESYRVFAQRFPDSTHVVEAAERGKAAQLRVAQQAFDKAIAGEQADQAAEALAQLRSVADAATLASAQERLERLRTGLRTKELQGKFPQLVAAIETSADPGAALAAARAALDTMRVSSPELAARGEDQIVAAQNQATARFVREGREAALRRDFTAATTQFGRAAAVARDASAVEKARAAAFAESVKIGQAEARQLAKDGNFDAAIAIADVLLGASPKARGLASERDRWKAAGERANQAAERSAAAAAEQARRRDEKAAEAAARDAKLQQERERKEQEAAAARSRSEQQLADAKARKEQELADAKARKEQELAAAKARKEQEAADRKMRDDAAKEAAAMKRRTAEEQRAAAKAAEAARVEQQRRDAEVARLKQEEERRQAAAAKLDAQLAKKAAAPLPIVVQFTLPARFATDDVLKRLPVPKSCTASIKRFFAKPTTCPTCAARAMSRVEMSCGAFSFSFLNDQRDVWLTCTGDKQNCADCLAAGNGALSPFIDAKERLQVVQGCSKH